MKLGNLKNVVYSIYGVGVLVDHITTNIGMNLFKLRESNLFTSYLIENGLWVHIDIILFISFVSIINFLNGKLTEKNNLIVLIFPLLSGSIRMMAGIMNMILLFQ